MTALDILDIFIEQRIADAEADLGPEAIGWIGMDATNRARGRVSALREVQQRIVDLEPTPLQEGGWAAWDALSPIEQWNADGNR